MWKNENRIGYVYKYTHKETGKWYIGSHFGEALDEDYTGSGVIWQKAKIKYGLENFTLDVLYQGYNFRNEEERILLLLDAQNDSMSYNMKNECLGGSFPGMLNGMYGKSHTPESAYKCGNAFRGTKRPDHSTAITGENNGRFIDGKNSKQFIESMRLYRKDLGIKQILNKTQCPHCCIKGIERLLNRYHFNNCPLNIKNENNIIDSITNWPRIDKRKTEFICPHCNKASKNKGNANRWHFDNCKEKPVCQHL